MTDQERLAQLLTDFGVTPSAVDKYGHELADDSEPEDDRQWIVLLEGQGGVQGYHGFSCEFAFSPEGKFISVGVWE